MNLIYQFRKNISIIIILLFALILVSTTGVVFSQSSSGQWTTTILILDNSDSMNEDDASNLTKLEAARNAGYRILEVLEAENQASEGSAGLIGVVSFNSSADVELSPTSNIDSARSALRNLRADGSTAMPDGLDLGIDLLEGSDPDVKPIIILLTDGMPNVGLNTDQTLSEDRVQEQVLDLASQAGNKGICIYTVGLGDPVVQNYDESFLRSVAARASCGAYYRAEDANELANIYVGLRHETTGQVLLRKSGEIQEGQVISIAQVEVPLYQDQMLFTLNWPGSELIPILTDPQGTKVSSTYPGISTSKTQSLATVIVQNPIPGRWVVEAQGAYVPQGRTTYNAVLSVRERIPTAPDFQQPTPISMGGTGIAIVIVILAGVIVYIVVLSQTKRRGRTSPRKAKGGGRLTILDGPSAGVSITLTEGMLAGRGSACQLRIQDRSASRQHAQFRSTRSGWYIYDLGSAAGTKVNGRTVSESGLKSGDIILLGNTRIEFR